MWGSAGWRAAKGSSACSDSGENERWAHQRTPNRCVWRLRATKHQVWQESGLSLRPRSHAERSSPASMRPRRVRLSHRTTPWAMRRAGRAGRTGRRRPAATRREPVLERRAPSIASRAQSAACARASRGRDIRRSPLCPSTDRRGLRAQGRDRRCCRPERLVETPRRWRACRRDGFLGQHRGQHRVGCYGVADIPDLEGIQAPACAGTARRPIRDSNPCRRRERAVS
jgi:hypothetical protein